VPASHEAPDAPGLDINAAAACPWLRQSPASARPSSRSHPEVRTNPGPACSGPSALATALCNDLSWSPNEKPAHLAPPKVLTDLQIRSIMVWDQNKRSKPSSIVLLVCWELHVNNRMSDLDHRKGILTVTLGPVTELRPEAGFTPPQAHVGTCAPRLTRPTLFPGLSVGRPAGNASVRQSPGTDGVPNSIRGVTPEVLFWRKILMHHHRPRRDSVRGRRSWFARAMAARCQGCPTTVGAPASRRLACAWGRASAGNRVIIMPFEHLVAGRCP
jgi:hypothetical protein